MSAHAEINVTPLVDVMLVLLIIVMLVAPLAERGLDTALPSPPERAAVGDPPALVLEIGDDGLRFSGTPVPSLGALGELLTVTMRARTNRTVFVRVSGAVTYGAVVDALDLAKGSGLERIGLIGWKP